MKKSMVKWLLPLLLVTACKKDDKVIVPDSITPAKGVYVLSEGSFGGNDTKLAYRDASTGTVSGDFFLQQNPSMTAGLGDTGNDIIIYGGKMYIVMNNSGRVVVLNASTATFIDSIPFRNGAANKYPRFALGYHGKVYVTSYDGTVSIVDTTSLNIVNSINVGPNPEGLTAVGNYLYVANSGGFNPVPDSTVSVVDLSTNMEIQKITACVNPQKIEVNSQGNLYVTGYGNFSTIPPTVAVLSSTTNTRTAVLGTDYSYDHLRIFNDTAYFYNNYGGAGSVCKVFNTLTNTTIRNEFITDGTNITTVYGINIDEQNGDVYITDAGPFSTPTPGVVHCFGRNGVEKFNFSVSPALNPNKVIFLR